MNKRMEHMVKWIDSNADLNLEYDKQGLESETITTEGNQAPLSVKILSILGGIVSMLTFIGFLLLAGLYDSNDTMAGFGVIFIIMANVLNQKFQKLFIDTFSVSAFLAGLVMLTFGIGNTKIDENVLALLFILIGSVSFIITRNFVFALVTLLTATGALFSLIFLNDAFILIHLFNSVFVFLLIYWMTHEAKIICGNIKLSRLYRPMRVGLILTLMMGLTSIGKKGMIPINENYIWLSAPVIFLGILYVIHKILEIVDVKEQKVKYLIYAFTIMALVPTIFAPSIAGALLILLLSFYANYKTGIVVGIVALIYFVGQYYYDLNLTLLTKSVILMSSGLILLMFYVFLNRKTATDEKI